MTVHALGCLSLAKDLCAAASTVSRAGDRGQAAVDGNGRGSRGDLGLDKRESNLLWLFACRLRTCVGEMKLATTIKAATLSLWGVKAWRMIAHVAPT